MGKLYIASYYQDVNTVGIKRAGLVTWHSFYDFVLIVWSGLAG